MRGRAGVVCPAFSLSGGLGASAPCVFQPLRPVGKALDGELVLLVPQSGPNVLKQTPSSLSGTPLPSGSLPLKAEFRRITQVPGQKTAVPIGVSRLGYTIEY